MRRTTVTLSTAMLGAAAWMLAAGIAPGCTCDTDESAVVPPGGGAAGPTGGSGGGIGLTGGSGGTVFQGGQGGSGNHDDPCGTGNPLCEVTSVGPTGDPPSEFPMPGDDPPPDGVAADGVTKDEDGFIVLDAENAQFDFLWVAADMNYGVGLVSKVRTTAFSTEPSYREAARYASVTCSSDPVHGSKEGVVYGTPPPGGLCADGVNGCCARAEWVAGANGGHQPVQTYYNRPSRTSVDINGDVWVANRAHDHGSYRQSSVTKIANNIEDCIDRNDNGVIDTSSDVNEDGIITTDCDNNNLPDDYDTVCTDPVNFPKEFYGLDDECILFTVNTGNWNGCGRPLALGPGDYGPSGPSDAWAGTFNEGVFYRIDGKTGAIKMAVQMFPQQGITPNPYGAAIDQFGILWAPNCCLPYLFYFDTNNPDNQGMVSFPGHGFYGIAIDGYTELDANNDPSLIQQIWLGAIDGGAGSGAHRYRPVRDQGFAGLGLGTWAYGNFPGGVTQGRGIGVDNRSPMSFAWVALDGYPGGVSARLGRIPIDIPDGVTQLDPNTHTFDTGQVGTTGAGVAFDGDVWLVAQGSSSVVHFTVDDNGAVTAPAHTVPLDDKATSAETFCGLSQCKPHPYTYSDFTGFGLKNFTNPSGYYAWQEQGLCPPGTSTFLRIEWDAEVPQGTALTVMARSAETKDLLDTATWTGKYYGSPADLSVAPGPLSPNPTNFIEVLFELSSDGDDTPKLKSFQIIYECEQVVPTSG